MKPLRIVLLMIEPPVPFGLAGARWYYVLLKGLVERGHKVTAFATCSDYEDIEKAKFLFPQPQYDLRCYPNPKRVPLIGKLQTLVRPQSHLIDSRLCRDLRTRLAEGYDLLHLEQIWAGWAGIGTDNSKAILNFHSLYRIDQSVSHAVSFRNAIERALQRRAEQVLLQSYPRLLTLTQRLRKVAKEIVPRADVEVIPLGIDTSLYRFIPAGKLTNEPIVTLIGSMNWEPGYTAAKRLLTRLWPEIKRRIPKARLRIVGHSARKSLAHMEAAEQKDVEIREDVPDTRPYFESAQVLLYAPPIASGMKVKVLESFAYGLPVVTNSEGIEGISAKDGIHAAICEDDAGLIERTITLLQNPGRREAQRVAARALLERECGTEATLNRLQDYYTHLTSTPNLS